MSIVVTYNAVCTIAETLETNVPAAVSANRVVKHNQFDTAKTLNATSRGAPSRKVRPTNCWPGSSGLGKRSPSSDSAGWFPRDSSSTPSRRCRRGGPWPR